MEKNLRCTPFTNNGKWRSSIKTLNDLLLTLDLLQSRYPDYITKDRCFFCQIYRESSEHLSSCTALENVWKESIDATINKAILKAKLKWDIILPRQLMLLLFKDSTASPSKGNSAITRWLKGIVPTTTVNLLIN